MPNTPTDNVDIKQLWLKNWRGEIVLDSFWEWYGGAQVFIFLPTGPLWYHHVTAYWIHYALASVEDSAWQFDRCSGEGRDSLQQGTICFFGTAAEEVDVHFL